MNSNFYEPSSIATIELYLRRTLVQYNFMQLLPKRITSLRLAAYYCEVLRPQVFENKA